MDYLVGFDGVGPKTAACVLLFGLGRDVMPVDTHVHRVVGRLGIVGRTGVEGGHVRGALRASCRGARRSRST